MFASISTPLAGVSAPLLHAVKEPQSAAEQSKVRGGVHRCHSAAADAAVWATDN